MSRHWLLVSAVLVGCSGGQYHSAPPPADYQEGYEEGYPQEGYPQEGTMTEEQALAYYQAMYGNTNSAAMQTNGDSGQFADPAPSNPTPAPTPNGTPACEQVIQQVMGSGGCQISLVSPANCATLDFSAGTVEFSWTTNGTFCEGPHRFFLGGHPSSTWQADNGFVVDINSTGGHAQSIGSNGSSYSMTRNIGGIVRLARADLNGMTTTTGQYHWGVTGFYDINNGGSSSGSRTFIAR